jgi:CheY-like chemotaxis protein
VPQKLVLKGDATDKFILLGEDDEDDQELLTDVFSRIDKSFSLLFVKTGTEIITVLSKLNGRGLPCLMVLDYNMPEMNGAEILRELNSHPKYHEIPKVVWSTSGSIEFKKRCLELGAQDYIIKPSTSLELEKIARYMLSFCR